MARLLDLFSGAGGAAVGYHRAGFDVTGVDVAPQRRYPFAFIQADALEYLEAHGHEYDAIHASPPCQRYSTITVVRADPTDHPDLVAPTRALLELAGRPWVIENVMGAPLRAPVMLCGTMFGLGLPGRFDLIRHRIWEASPDVAIWPPASCHHAHPAIGVYGHPGGRSRREDLKRGHRGLPAYKFGTGADWRVAMGIDWMTTDELAEAIPPAYTEHVGRALLAAVRARAILTAEA